MLMSSLVERLGPRDILTIAVLSSRAPGLAVR